MARRRETRLLLKTAGLSDTGRARLRNEDAFEILVQEGVCVVADGMGGHGNGEIASRVAIDAIHAFYEEDEQAGGGDDGGIEAEADRLNAAVEEANLRVLRAAEADRDLEGMGTTICCLRLLGDTVFVAHVGDSRVYRFRERRLSRLTTDHTWVQEQVEAGLLSVAQSQVHPMRNVITRALGGAVTVEVDRFSEVPNPGDLYLLCTDGLTGMVPDEEVQRILDQEQTLEEMCGRLIAEANVRGGLDNITAVLARVC